MQRDWRDSKAGLLAWAVVTILIMVPKPWLTPWQNVGVDAVLIPLGLWLIAPAVRRTIGRGPKVMGIVLAGLLVTGLWGTAANAGTIRMSDIRIAYETAKSKAPCLTAEQRSVIRAKVALKAFILSAERYAKQHWPEQMKAENHWAPNDPMVYDPRLYEPKAYDAILHDAVQDYLAYARKVGRAILAHNLNPAGVPCSRAVVASLHRDGITFENEDELSASPLEISQYEGGAPLGHGFGDSPGYGGLTIDRNFESGPGPGCCIHSTDLLQLGGMSFGWAEIVLGMEVLGLPSVVQGITSPPLDLTRLMSGLIYLGKGFVDFLNAVRGGSGGGGGGGGDPCCCGCSH